MKIFQTLSTKSQASADGIDVQSTPVRADPADGLASAQIKVDLVIQSGETLLVAGWRSHPLELGVVLDGQPVVTRVIEIDRPDVNAHFRLPSNHRCGFVLMVDAPPQLLTIGEIRLSWAGVNQERRVSKGLKLQSSASLTLSEQAVLGPALLMHTGQLVLNSPEWRQLISKTDLTEGSCAGARGVLEGAAACDQTKDAVVVGWVVLAPGTRVWLEDPVGYAYSLDGAFRRFRQDVHDSVGNEFGHASRDAGFVSRLKGLKAGAQLSLRAMTETGVYTLSHTTCGALPLDPVGAARWLFAIGTPASDLNRRIPLVDEPMLSPLIENRLSVWDELPVVERALGKPCNQPLVSIVIPLFGRIDFVEHQLLEFIKDDWLKQNAEIIYVVDDPSIVENLNATAETLFRLYQLPFRWVWGNVNRGFSGANNLGAKYAKSQNLVFLNSDAFPKRPGWLQEMLHTLEEHPSLGAVGVRLLFGDGGIQHAGMEFHRREEMGIWVNHHPRMGLDPSLDPQKGLTVVPAVTGACMALRRSDFDRIGGWDTGYLIGDFEDSDLCLKLRAEGMSIGYLPQVELIHLERQSFKLLGQDEFRQRVVIYNAVRHQGRWGHLIAQRIEAGVDNV